MPVSTVTTPVIAPVFQTPETFDKQDKKTYVPGSSSAQAQETPGLARATSDRTCGTPTGHTGCSQGAAEGETKSGERPRRIVCTFPGHQLRPIGDVKVDGPHSTEIPKVKHNPGDVVSLPAVIDGAAQAGVHEQTTIVRGYEDPRAEILLGSGEHSPTKTTISDEQIKNYWLNHTPDESFSAALAHNVSVARIIQAVTGLNVANANKREHKEVAQIMDSVHHFLESKGVDIKPLSPLPSNQHYEFSSYVDVRSEILFNNMASGALSPAEIRAVMNDASLSVDQKITQFLSNGVGVADVFGALRDPGATLEDHAKLYDQLLAHATRYALAHGFDISQEALYVDYLVPEPALEESVGSPGSAPTIMVEPDDTVYPETLEPAIPL